MKIFVQVWCEIDPTLNVRIDRNTGTPMPEPGDKLMRVSPLGRYGVDTAVNLCKLSAGKVTAFCIGNEDSPALRHALASGASEAIVLETSHLSAATLSAWLKTQSAKLVICDRIAGLVAYRLGWSHLSGIDQLQIKNNKLHCLRFLERGNREQMQATLPAIIRLQQESVKPRYVPFARLEAVKDKEFETVKLIGKKTSREIEVGPLQQARARTKVGQRPMKTKASGMDRLSALMTSHQPKSAPTSRPKKDLTPQQLAEDFVRYLGHQNLL